ncbi:hypothetical protein ACFE04_031787 [Oxalis oulophora]
MGSFGYPKTLIPYMQTKDCSYGICSVYCPQWCYFVIPPPPPPYGFANENSAGPRIFSPLVITVIGISAFVFLLISYYTVFYKYCLNSNSTQNEASEDNRNPSIHETWQVGLDEALIKSITTCKYKEGSIEGTDCSVCLGEFQEDENVRLLPKCSHAFHVECIDTWLKSNSSCPLCRANIIISIAMNSLPLPVTEVQNQNQDSGRNNEEERMHSIRGAPKSSLQVFTELEERHTVIEIRDQGYGSIGCSKQTTVGSNKSNNRLKRVLRCVISRVAMKRSYSSSRFLLSRRGMNGGMMSGPQNREEVSNSSLEVVCFPEYSWGH